LDRGWKKRSESRRIKKGDRDFLIKDAKIGKHKIEGWGRWKGAN